MLWGDEHVVSYARKKDDVFFCDNISNPDAEVAALVSVIARHRYSFVNFLILTNFNDYTAVGNLCGVTSTCKRITSPVHLTIADRDFLRMQFGEILHDNGSTRV